ncbi:MAG: AAA family ATPase, partial [Proteobacteria bacterium]|nr:AAA family ATPase [Pseudomonadota bacterium]
LPVGKSDFRELRKNDFFYVDKSLFIREILDTAFEVILLPRPRRFGKTLNLSMLRYFFEKDDVGLGGGLAGDFAELFEGTAIREDEVFQRFQGKYPVIYLTFKDVKYDDWEECLEELQALIGEEYARHRYLLDGETLYPEEKTYFLKILEESHTKTACQRALKKLSMYLARYHGKKVVILIDEYDTPLHAGYAKKYYGKVIGFMRNFLSGGLKDNVHLFKGVLTGILRVAKESIFSDLNNPGVYTLLDEEFNTAFGFTENELKSLLDDNDLSDHYDDVSSWYNGYNFGGEVIYNPWSVLNYAARKAKKLRPFWVNTASTELIDKLVIREGRELRKELGQLLEGKTIKKPVYENIVMKNLEIQDDLLWSLLLFSGYLKPVEEVGDETYTLKIPNQEVTKIYRGLIKTWFAEKIEPNQQEELVEALEAGNVELFERGLREVVIRVMSFHDFSGAPEKVYQALMVGMLVWCSDNYAIRSNRESGYGRYDLMMQPKDIKKRGIIMEFKRIDEKRGGKMGDDVPEKTLNEALKQIEARQYETEMNAAGVNDILKLAIAFKGKELWVRSSG